MMSFDEIIKEIEKEYKDSYEEIIESGVFRDPLNYYLVCVYPIKPFKGAESKPEEMFLNFKDEVALYFHIPFCQRRCSFCNFIICVSSKKDFVDQYLNALNKEAILVKNALQKGGSSPKIHSVYIGGGTPTYLEEAQIKFLLNKIIKENFNEYFPSDGLVELTMEASPGTLTEQKVKLLKDLGVNRISIGIQTFDDETLKLMNRDHDSNLAYQSIAYIGDNFKDRFNIDLISGLPIPKDWDRRYFFERLFNDLKIVIEKNIPSVTFYHLWTRGMENTSMMKKVLTGEWILPTRGEVVKLWIMINKILSGAGYRQEPAGWFVKSENSVFKQQLFKWSEKYEYFGLGVSSYGYFNNYIYWNISNIQNYISILNSNKLPIYRIKKISSDENDRKRAVFSIKTTKGLNLSELNNKKLFSEEIEILKFLGLVNQENSSIKLTPKGYVFFDEVSEFFFDEEDRKSIKKKLDIYTISRNRLNFLIRKCIVEKSEDLKGSSYDFKEKWEKFLTIHLFPRIKDTLEFFLKQTLGEKYVRFLLAYIYIDDNDKVYFLKPYYSSHNEWYQNVILPWFQTKINENKAISLTQTFFEPPYKIVEPYFPPPFSLSLEFPVRHPADINIINIEGVRSELVNLLKNSSSVTSISQIFQQMYSNGSFKDNVLEDLFNKSNYSSALKKIFSQIKTIILSRYPSKKETEIFKELEKNPWKLLPSLLAFLGNDDANVKHFIFIPLDLNEKCLPLVVVLELKDMIDDKEFKQIFEFFVSTFPIITSYEERIRMEIKHNDSLSHALKSAIAAIMARNLAHIFASQILTRFKHVNINRGFMSEFISQNWEQIPEKLRDYLKNGFNILIPDELLDYMITRSEYIADATGDVPLLWGEGFIHTGIIEEFQETHILEKFCEAASGKFREIKIVTENLDDRVGFPFGMAVGRHAVYGILENYIRNVSKYGDVKANSLEVKLSKDVGNENKAFILVKLTSNSKIAQSPGEFSSEADRIDRYISQPIIDEKGALVPHGWGFQEMKIHACILSGEEVSLLSKRGKLDFFQFDLDNAKNNGEYCFYFKVRRYEPFLLFKNEEEIKNFISNPLEFPLTDFIVFNSHLIGYYNEKTWEKFSTRICILGSVSPEFSNKWLGKKAIFIAKDEDIKESTLYERFWYLLKNHGATEFKDITIFEGDGSNIYVHFSDSSETNSAIYNIYHNDKACKERAEKHCVNNIRFSNQKCMKILMNEINKKKQKKINEEGEYIINDEVIKYKLSILLGSKVLLIDKRLFEQYEDMKFETKRELNLLGVCIAPETIRINDDLSFTLNNQKINLNDFQFISVHLGYLEENPDTVLLREDKLGDFPLFIFSHTARGKIDKDFISKHWWFKKIISASSLISSFNEEYGFETKIRLMGIFLSPQQKGLKL